MTNPAFLYDSRFDDGTPAASTTGAGDVLNLLDWRPHTIWAPSAMPATVTVDAGSAKAADYALIAGHDLGTVGATAEIRSSTDDFAASDDLEATVTPTDDDLIALFFTSASRRYWRLQLTGAAVPTIGLAAIGALTEVPAALAAPFDPLGTTPQGSFSRSVAGNPLGRTIDYELWAASLTFDLVTWAWLRATWQPAWAAHLRSLPFGFAWERDAYPGETRLVRATGGFDAPHRSGSVGNLKLRVDGVA